MNENPESTSVVPEVVKNAQLESIEERLAHIEELLTTLLEEK